jgi:hypothetical protein
VNTNPLTAQTHTISRLTALWALSESGLGGMMHAVKIPFTGFFLGGFAIVIITLIAYFSETPFKSIIQATVLVLLVKAAASPHSPPMAYIAVGFQGLAGALLFAGIPFYRLAACLFGMIALFESAVQKFFVATLIFGKNIWEALDGFVAAVLKDLSVFHDFSFSFWMVLVYTSVYVVWGCIVGWWASGLPKVMNERSAGILLQYNRLNLLTVPEKEHRKHNRYRKIATLILVLVFIVLVFWVQGSEHKVLYAITRTIAALLILFYLFNPLVKWIIQRWLNTKRSSAELQSVLETLPEIRSYLAPAMQLARRENSGLGVYKTFVENLILLVLYT